LVNINVVSLGLVEFGELSIKGGQVENSDLLVEVLGEDVDLSLLVFVTITVLPEFKLSEDLVSERAGHNERWVTSSTTQVEESALGEEDDTVTIGELVAINLFLNVLTLDAWVGFKTFEINLIIKMTDVTNDSVVLHLGEVLGHNNISVTSGSDKDISSVHNRLKALDLVAFHACLKGTDGIDLSHDDTAAICLHGSSTALADITESHNNDLLTSKHDIGGTHKTIGKRVFASVNVIELLLGNRVVDVDSSEEELSLLGHLLKSVDTSSGFLRETDEVLSHFGPHISDTLFKSSSDDLENDLEFLVGGRCGVRKSSKLLEVSLSLDTFVHHDGSITTVINKHVWAFISRPSEHLEGTFPVFFKTFSLPGEDISGLGSNDSSGSLILSGVDVA